MKSDFLWQLVSFLWQCHDFHSLLFSFCRNTSTAPSEKERNMAAKLELTQWTKSEKVQIEVCGFLYHHLCMRSPYLYTHLRNGMKWKGIDERKGKWAKMIRKEIWEGEMTCKKPTASKFTHEKLVFDRNDSLKFDFSSTQTVNEYIMHYIHFIPSLIYGYTDTNFVQYAE